MKPTIYRIPKKIGNGYLAIMPRPRAGEWLNDELKGWHTSGIDVIVSLLTLTETVNLDLQDEAKICQEQQIEYISYPIDDRRTPASSAATLELIKRILEKLKQGKGVAIHCRMGIGRSALIAACVVVSQGLEVKAAFDLIGKARGIPVPDTDEQKKWVEQFASDFRQLEHS
jgi:protein-tyrosine phosphatase